MNVVVTGGGTLAPIDDVRQLANVSTGRFSAEITESCLRRGSHVWHVHAPYALLPFRRLAGFDLDRAEPDLEINRILTLRRDYLACRDRLHMRPLREGTVADYSTTLQHVFRDAPIDIAFLAMAVSDYEPQSESGKIRSDQGSLTLLLRPTPKVIRKVRDWSPEVYLVGFKLLSGASSHELVSRTRESGIENRANLTVGNDLRQMREGRHTLQLVRPGHPDETLGPGGDLADRLVERVISWAKDAVSQSDSSSVSI
ncbi:MAG: phosphopantothenoylcysteine synthetase/decarboxylase [Planctomycetota bacterium]|nr:phosphopantothenoylcysteine synthetase/decarboxylase [Planctomycetota bacterium]